MKINLWLLIFCILTTSAVWAQQAGSDNDDYALELVKHYLAKEKIDLALQAALQNQDQTSQPDSLAWLTASIYYQKNQTFLAADEFARLIKISSDSLLIEQSLQRLIRISRQLKPKKAIDLLVDILEDVQDDQYLKLILVLAEIYEENYLYSEANDIYLSLIDSDFNVDQQDLYIKIAANQVFTRKYKKAVEFATKAESYQDSTGISRALFIKYVSYQALQDSAKALPVLLKLYLDHQDFAAIWEINYNLAQLLNAKGHFLAAWYVLEKYFPRASATEKEIIILEIRQIIANISLNDDQFNHFDLFKEDFQKLLPPNP